MLTLDQVPQHQPVRVVDVAGEDAIAIRLMEMGLTEGVEISLIGAAPLGDPLEFLIRGYHLSLRKTEASRVTVEVLPA